jgi:GT2 family glycosyltransferase|tara:strand:- start:5353 stop:6255 length:903 start_codon:yes stop_codon:yes gene_type:complete
MHKITSVIPTYNNLPFLKLTVQSVRENCYYNDMPIIIFAENCTDGTNEWLAQNADELNIEYYIENDGDRENQRGIGGGIDLCVSKVKTEFVNILHSDFWVAPNQDIELLKLFEEFPDDRLITSSFRVQPNIFPNDPPYRPGTIFVPFDQFGVHEDDFEQRYFDDWSTEFSEDNDIRVRKAGGAGYLCRVEDQIAIGGNDPRFEPMYWEDKDLFMRMQMEDYKFIMTSKSVIWHFTSRTSRFPDGTKNLDNNQRPAHIVRWEQRAMERFIEKWGRLPEEDADSFVVPITGTNNPNKIEWPF